MDGNRPGFQTVNSTHNVVSASSLTAFSSLTASIYLQILDNMGSRSKNIQIASAAETARLRTDQEKEARRAKTGGTQGHAPTRELRRDIAEAQTGAARKKAAPKSSRGGGQSPAEAGRDTARGRLDFQEEDGQPLCRISGGNTRRVSGTSASRGDAGASRLSKKRRVELDSDVEEEEEPTKHGKKGESTASDSEEELQPEPSPKRTKKTNKKGG